MRSCEEIYAKISATGTSVIDNILPNSNSKKLHIINTRLEFWDVSGQERYGTMLKTYYKDASGIILICDVSRDTTIESIPKWNKTIMKFCPEDIPRILLINKVDLVDDTYDYSHFNDLCDKNEIIA